MPEAKKINTVLAKLKRCTTFSCDNRLLRNLEQKTLWSPISSALTGMTVIVRQADKRQNASGEKATRHRNIKAAADMRSFIWTFLFHNEFDKLHSRTNRDCCQQ